jgi:hypothetical protein
MQSKTNVEDTSRRCISLQIGIIHPEQLSVGLEFRRDILYRHQISSLDINGFLGDCETSSA